MPRKNSNIALLVFLMGLLSHTQIRVIGYMDISEFISYIIGPILFIMDLPQLRKHGFGTFLLMWFLVTCGALFSSWYNHSPTPLLLRGIASPISVFCLTCVFHHLLSKDFMAFKWFFLGVAISGVISVYIFQRGTGISRYGEVLTGDEAVENIVNYSLFWLATISTWLNLPIQMAYSRTPKWYCIVFGVWYMLYGIFSAGSRSGLLVSGVFLFLILVAGKTRESMMFMKKHILSFFIAFVAIGLLMTSFYRYAAVNNYLGEKAYKKYMVQTQGKSGVMNLIRGGRADFFIGLEACLERPFVGWGPWAVDTEGIVYKYIKEYGSDESLADYNRIIGLGGTPRIPGHSYVITFWLWYGILGGICMLYVGWLYFTTLKNRMHVVPELYGYLAFILPSVIWAWFFSPFGTRTISTFLMVICLFVKAIDERRYYVTDEDGMRRQ